MRTIPTAPGARDVERAEEQGHGSRLAGRARPGENGSMTVFMVGVIAAALVLAVLTGGLVRGVTARGQAQAAADLAALAAAEVAAVGGPTPCETARRVSARNRAVLTGCDVSDGGMVQLVTTVAVHPLPGWQDTARATARAGPVGRA